MSLAETTPEPQEMVVLGPRFDTFRNDVDIELIGDADQPRYHRRSLDVGSDHADERRIKLEDVDRRHDQVTQ